jgi:hypothetical protein
VKSATPFSAISSSQVASSADYREHISNVLHVLVLTRRTVPEIASHLTELLVNLHFESAVSVGDSLLVQWLTVPGALDKALDQIDPVVSNPLLSEEKKINITRSPAKSGGARASKRMSMSPSTQKSSRQLGTADDLKTSVSKNQTFSVSASDGKEKKNHFSIIVMLVVLILSVVVGCSLSLRKFPALPLDVYDSTVGSALHDGHIIESIDEQQLAALENVLWVKHGNSVAIRGTERGVAISPVQCMQMVTAFSRNTSFCNNAFVAEGEINILKEKRREEHLLYRWFKDGKILPEKDSQLLSLERIGYVDEGQYHCLRLNLSATSGALQSVAVVNLRLSGKSYYYFTLYSTSVNILPSSSHCSL